MKTQIKITYVENTESALEFADQESSAECNVSHKEDIINNDVVFHGYKGFHLAAEQDKYPANLSGNYKCYGSEGYKGYCSQVLSGANNFVDISIVVQLTGKMSSTLFIVFDYACQEYATEMTIRNNHNLTTIDITNNTSPLVFINLALLGLTDYVDTILTIRVTKWNHPYKNIKISRLSFSYVETYTNNTVVRFDCSRQLIAETFAITPKVIEQYADIVIYDRTNAIKTLAIEGYLTDKLPVFIYVYPDTVTQKLLGMYLTDTWEVNSNSGEISLTCKDKTQNLSGIYLGENLDVTTRTLDAFLSLILSDIAWQYIDTDTRTYCQNIYTPDSWLYNDTLMNILNKICAWGFLSVYQSGEVLIVARCY